MNDFRIGGPGDDSGSILLECQVPKCWWSTEVGGYALDDINDLAKDHHDEVHTA